MTSLTVFHSIFDNKTNKKIVFEDWENLENLLYELHDRATFKPSTREEQFASNSAKLISPAIYKSGTKRRNENVLYWDEWCALDIDSYEGTFEDILESFGDFYYVCYSTGSSTKEKPKFRLVFPLTCSVKADKIGHFWYALNKEFGQVADAQTKDYSRMFYVPGQYPDAYNFIFTHEGPILSPYDLMKKYPYVEPAVNFFDRLPQELQDSILENRKSDLSRNISWTSYHDCPFVKRDLVDEYKTITGTGWYHTMYRIMVSIAASAIHRKFDITAIDIENLCRQIDNETGGWYKDRDMKSEADRAIEWVYKNSIT